MDQKIIVANWKSNKTTSQAEEWFKGLTIKDVGLMNKEIVVCPSFTLISSLKSLIINHQSSIRLGAQDISPFNEGAYTGEVSASQIKEFADYVIIGHSERRQYFAETEEVVNQKISQATEYGLIPIVCISTIAQISNLKNLGKTIIVAYEPLSAIGSGSPDTPENANNVARKIKTELGDALVLYGGSVDSSNVQSFTHITHIDGVLVGQASLDPASFKRVIENA